MPVIRVSNSLILVAALALSAVFSLQAMAGPSDAFPEPRPANRAEAASLIVAETPSATCLTPQLHVLGTGARGSSPAIRRAAAILGRRANPAVRRVGLTADGSRIDAFYPVTLDGVSASPASALVPEIMSGLDQARKLLVERLGLAAPAGIDVVLTDLGGAGRGYLVPGDASQATLVLDAGVDSTGATVRHAAAHQYAHAVALTAGRQFSPVWAEALAEWTHLALEGAPDREAIAAFSLRIEELGGGLASEDLELAAGDALWLAFVEDAYGASAVRATVEDLARGGSVPAALDRALRRVVDTDLAAAFREFHLWTVLVGARSDRFHFPFAARLSGPAFASENAGLPAVSVQADPAVAGWGATQIRIRPGAEEGGLRVHFDGDLGTRWEADLLLVEKRGDLRRVPVTLSAEGRGDAIVPLGAIDEVLLLVRSLGGDDPAPHHYTYAANVERGYPVELVSLEAAVGDASAGSVALMWETASEQDLVGFNVLRVREEGGREVAVNPMWIPSLGDETNATSYFYLDQTAKPGASYLYRVEAVTRQGLSAFSDPVVVRPAATAR